MLTPYVCAYSGADVNAVDMLACSVLNYAHQSCLNTEGKARQFFSKDLKESILSLYPEGLLVLRLGGRFLCPLSSLTSPYLVFRLNMLKSPLNKNKSRLMA